MHLLVRRLAVAISASAIVLVGAMPVDAAWTSSVVDPSYFLTRPSLRVDSTDHTGVAYQRAGDSPGIFYAFNGTGSFVAERATTGADYAPSLRFDAANKAHVAFARLAGTTGVYVTDRVAGSWAAPTLVAADLDPTLPSLALDGSGHQAIAYVSNYSFAPGLYFATNATGSWVRTRVTTGAWDGTPSLAFDPSGHAWVVFARYEPGAQGLYYATNATGSWVVTQLSTDNDDSPSLVFDGAGKAYVAFRRYTNGQEMAGYAGTIDGQWWCCASFAYYSASTYGPPSIFLDPTGSPHVFISIYADRGSIGHLYHFVLDGTGAFVPTGPAPTDDSARSDDFPSLGFLSDGTVQLAFRRSYPSAGIRVYTAGSNSTLLSGSHADSNASIDLSPSSARDMAFSRRDGSGGSQVFATGTGSGWTLDTAGTDNPNLIGTDITADGSGKVRIVDGVGYDSNAVSAWTHDTSQPAGSDSEVETDANGHAHVLFAYTLGGQWILHYKMEVSPGTFMDTCACIQTDIDPMASFVLDGLANPQIAWIDTQSGNGSNSALTLTAVSAFAWGFGTVIDSGPNAWPSIAIDGAGKLHIAYIHGGSTPGIYYATNKTGTWVKTRLTKSFSDGAPSIALDATGHVYIATTRAIGAVNPGIYVMTNATGAWVTARVVPTADAGDVSLAVTSGGLARMVFATSTGIVEYEDSTTTITVPSNGLATVLRDQLRIKASADVATPTGGHRSTPTRWGPTTGLAVNEMSRTTPGRFDRL